jgi:hypothetical protein
MQIFLQAVADALASVANIRKHGAMVNVLVHSPAPTK